MKRKEENGWIRGEKSEEEGRTREENKDKGEGKIRKKGSEREMTK